MHRVRQAGQVLVALLDDGEGQHAQVHADNAAAHALAAALAVPPGAVAAVAGGEQQAHARRVHHALLHREPLLVVAPRDAEHVALELGPDGVPGHFLPHPPIHEDPQLALVFDVDQFLRPVRRVADVELHGCLGGWRLERKGGETMVEMRW